MHSATAELIQAKFPLEEILADNPQYLIQMRREKWAKGGGDFRFDALRATNVLLERQISLLRALDEKLNFLIDERGGNR